MKVPGGGAFGRSALAETRNPILGLPSARAIQALPIEQRRPLGILLRELARECDVKAEDTWRARKGIMAAYWRATSTYPTPSTWLAPSIRPICAVRTDATCARPRAVIPCRHKGKGRTLTC